MKGQAFFLPSLTAALTFSVTRIFLLAYVALALALAGSPLNGQVIVQPATTVQLPTFGVSVDAQGVLTTPLFAEAGDPLFQQRAQLAKARLAENVFAPSKLRKVSLRKLAETIAEKEANGEKLDETILKLAGLVRVQYVFILPEQKDIILAGPAEGWMPDAAGRIVGITSGLPTILLEDLVVALRAYGPEQPNNLWVGCTINPTGQALANLNEFNRSVPSRVPQSARADTADWMVNGMRDALGLADIVVFSISAKTHMARIMIEADYRMKLIAVGLEAPPIRMPTFFSQLKSPPKNSYQRWWFTPNYKAVKLTEDRQSMEFISDGVQLLTDDYGANAKGQLVKTGRKPSGPAKRYASVFTKKYGEIAERSPIFQQLRNMIDLLIVGAYLQQENAFEQIDLVDNVFQDNEVQLVRLLDEPLKTPCVANATWKGSRLIAVAGGGVSIQANKALLPENVQTAEKESQLRIELVANLDQESWWWD